MGGAFRGAGGAGGLIRASHAHVAQQLSVVQRRQRGHATSPFSVALCAFSVSSVSGMDRSRELCVAMSPCIASLLFDTEHTEKAQRATES